MAVIDPFAADRKVVDPFRSKIVDPFSDKSPSPDVPDYDNPTPEMEARKARIQRRYSPQLSQDEILDAVLNPVDIPEAPFAAELRRQMEAQQEYDRTRTPIRDTLRDVARIPKEIPKALARGVEHTEAAVGPAVSAVGDYIETQQRQWSNIFWQSPIGRYVGEKRRKKYIEEHGSLPPSSISAAPETLGGKISNYGEFIYDTWNEMANTGWEAPDPEIYAGTFLENPSLTRVVGGASESAPTMITALGLSAAGHPGAGAALLAGTEAAPIYIEAKRAGVSESDAFSYALISGLGTAALERVGLDAIMGKNPLVDKVIQKMGAKWYSGALVNFTVEGSQEALQEIYQNAVAMGWDGDRKLLDGALEAGLAGGLLGGGASMSRTIYHDYMQRHAENAKGMTDAEIDAAVRESMRPENAQIQLERIGQSLSGEIPAGAQDVQRGPQVIDVSELVRQQQGIIDPVLQQRVLDLANQEQPLPERGAIQAADAVQAALPLPAEAEAVPPLLQALRAEQARISRLQNQPGQEPAALPATESQTATVEMTPGQPAKSATESAEGRISFEDMQAEAQRVRVQPGRNVLMVNQANGKPYTKAKRVRIYKAVDDQHVQIKWKPPGKSTEVFETVSIDRLQEPANVVGQRMRGMRMAGLSKDERRSVTEAEREFNKILMESDIFTNEGDLQELEGQPTDRQRKIAWGQHRRQQREIAFKLLGAEEQDFDDPRDIAQLLPKLQEYVASEDNRRMAAEETRKLRRVKQASPQEVNEAELEDKALVWRDGEWYMVNRDDAMVTRLSDGTVEQLDAFDSLTVSGVLDPDSPGYDAALQEFKEQRAEEEAGAGEVVDPFRAWQEKNGVAPGPEQAEMFGKGAVGDAFELRSETVKGEETFSERKDREARTAEAQSRQGAFYDTVSDRKGGTRIAGESGLGDEYEQADDPAFSAVPFEMPELVEIAEALGKGKIPKIRERLGRAAGVFRFRPGVEDSGSIELLASTFKLIQPAEEQALRDEARAYAEKLQEADPTIDFPQVQRDKFEQLYDAALEEAKKRDPVYARKVLAHEIGHWVDFLPDSLLTRGNLLGHIAALKGYTKTLLEEKPGSGGVLTSKERAKLRRQAEKDLKTAQEVREIVEEITREEPVYKTLAVTPDDIRALMGMNARETTPELYEWFARQVRQVKKDILKAAMQGVVDERAKQFDKKEKIGTRTVTETVRRTVGGGPVSPEKIRQRYQDLLKEEIRQRRLHELAELKQELEPVIAWWNGTEEMPDYYKQPAEMFADSFSVFLNNPKALAKRAPKFYKALMDHISSRPEWQRTYNDMQELVRTGGVQQNRRRKLRRRMEQSDQNAFEQEQTADKLTRDEAMDWARYTVDRVFGPVYRRLSDGPGTEGGRVTKALEDYLYRATGHEHYLSDVNRMVLRDLVKNDLTWMDLAEYMFHQRVVNERYDIANPWGFTAKSSREALDAMQENLGPERYAQLEKAQRAAWELRKKHVVEPLKNSGLVDDQLLKKIEENLYYATFAVSRGKTTADRGSIEEMLRQTYGSNVGAKIFRQVGTLKDVQNVATATVQKDLSLITAALRNQAKREVVGLMLNEYKDEIQPAQKRFTGVRKEFVMKSGKRVGTLVVMENGKPQAYYVPRVIAEAFESGSPIENQVMIRILGAPTRLLKAGYTQANYGFWPVAFVRDVWDFKRKMPGRGFHSASFWKYYMASWKAAKSSISGSPNELAQEALRRKMMISVADAKGLNTSDEAFERMLQRFHLVPESWRGKNIPVVERVVKAWMKWLRYGEVNERLVKIAGMKYLDDNFKDMAEWEKQYLVHNMAGSPNFLQKGAANPYIDFAMMFYNPWKESLRGEGIRWKRSPMEAAWHTAKYDLAPKVLMLMAATGGLAWLLGERRNKELEEMYSYVSDYDKTNYLIVPLGWVDQESGKVAYLRIPQSEPQRLVSGVFWKAAQEDPDLRALGSYAGGQLPSGNPILSTMIDWTQYLSGNNPYDEFRGRPLMPDDVAQARDARGLEVMAKHTANNLGAGLVMRFNRDSLYNSDPTGLEKFLNKPIISNLLGRWVKVSNLGRYEDLQRTTIGPVRTDRARVRLDAQEAVLQWLRQGDESALDADRIKSDPYYSEYIGKLIDDGLAGRRNLKPELRAILDAQSAQEKEALLLKMIERESAR